MTRVPPRVEIDPSRFNPQRSAVNVGVDADVGRRT